MFNYINQRTDDSGFILVQPLKLSVNGAHILLLHERLISTTYISVIYYIILSLGDSLYIHLSKYSVVL
jgi:hypothetical protein